MIRPKLLPRLVVSLIFLSTALVASAYGETVSPQSITADQGLSPGNTTNNEEAALAGCEDCPPDSKPYFVGFSAIDSLFLCEGQGINDTFIVNDSNLEQTITIEMLSGPGMFSSTPGNSPVYGYYEYTPDAEGSFDITLLAYDDGGDSTIVTKTYYVFINQTPIITSGDTTFFQCYGGSYFYYDVEAFDPDSTSYLRFKLLSHGATIDFYTGEIQFWADQPGVYCHLVEVSDECGADTAEICVTIVYNTSPSMNNPDQTFYICEPDSICFDIFASDPDGEDIIISQVEGPGVFNMTGKTSGRTCFMPADVDSADYVFIYEAVDSCLALKCTDEAYCPPTPVDTVVITVVKGQTAFLDCPGDTSLFICEPDTLCFPIGDLPEGTIVSVEPGSAWFDDMAGTVCFYTNCSVKKDLMVIAESVCGIDTCMFSVDVTMNSAPLVILAPDTSLFACELSEICISAGISDVDDNLENITVEPFGTYDEVSGTVCFTPEEAGLNTIIVTAMDACGALDVDSINVDITINSAPQISGPSDTSIYLCNLETICIPLEVSDIDDNLNSVVVSPLGYWEDGSICFVPDTAGSYGFTLTATDDCGAETDHNMTVMVGIDRPPVVVANGDSSVFMCELEQVCFPVAVSDPDGNLAEVEVIGDGVYSNGYVCFTPTAAGEYQFIINATDDCGNVGSDTTVMEIVLNSPPVVEMIDSVAVSQCEIDEICIDVDAFDPDDNITSISTNYGYYDAQSGQVCFTPDGRGTYNITVTATDECFASDSKTTIVTVYVGETASIDCPDGPIYKSLCNAETICRPLGIMPAWADISVSYGVYENGELCFTADSAGIYNITVIADAECGSDTCELVFDITMDQVPEIVCPADTAINLCGPDAVCLPVEISTPDAEIMIVPRGYYENGMVCFDADSAGRYEFHITVENDCGMDSCSFAVDVSFNTLPEIVTGGTSMFLCEPGTVEYDIDATDADNDQIIYSITAGEGEIDAETGLLSFNADTSGVYCFGIAAADDCGADTVDICIDIAVNSAPVVVSADDYQISLCEPSPQCFPVEITDAEDNITDISVNIGAYSHGYVCFTPSRTGTYEFIITVTDECGAVDVDTTVIDVITNSAPTVVSAADFDTLLCEPTEICVDVEVNDIDENIKSIFSNIGDYSFETGQVCFTPDAGGEYLVITTVIDSCDASAVDTTVVNIAIDEIPVIACPGGPLDYYLCEPREICYPLAVSSGTVTVSNGTYVNGELCFMADTAGTYNIEVIAASICGADTCNVIFEVGMGETPWLTCPDDTSFNLCGPDVICIPVNVGPADAHIAVLPIGYYEEGMVCFNADTAGHYEIWVEVANECGEDTCSFAVDVTLNSTPEIVTGDTAMFICEPGVIEYQITANDAENDEIIYSLSAGAGSVDAETGMLSFTAEESGKYCFTVVAADECGADTADVCFDITVNSAPVVISAEDDQLNICGKMPYCFAVDVSDVDDNIVDMTVSMGSYSHGYVCFSPTESGSYEFIITATDACGEVAADTTVIDVVVNTPPVVISAPDIDTFMCEIAEICVDVEISDTEENIKSITSEIGQFNPETNQVCFTPDGEGTYYIVTTAVDSCDASDTDTTVVNVTIGSGAEIACPEGPIDLFLCGAEEYCFPLEISAQSVTVSHGTYTNGELCFPIDTAGVYSIMVIADAECGSDTCNIDFNVTIGETADIVCPNDTTIITCGPETICLPVTVLPGDAYVTATPFGLYRNGIFCFDADQEGRYEFTLTAESDCGTDSCTFAVDVVFNRTPEIVSGDTAIFTCYEMDSYTIQLQADDYESDDITFSLISGDGYVNPEEGLLTIFAGESGTYCYDVAASDYCSADTATICVTLTVNSAPIMTSGPDTTVITCSTADMCIPVEILDADDNLQSVTVNMGVYADGQVCFSDVEPGTYEIITTAVDECGASDADTTLVTVVAGQSLTMECPGDTSLFICEPDTLCIPVGGIPEGAPVIVEPVSAWYDADKQAVCFYTNCSVDKNIKIIAETDCAIDSCMFLVDVTMNSDPLVIMQSDTTLALCAPQEVCLAVGISDADDNIIDVEVSNGTVYDAVTGKVCFTPIHNGENVIKVRAIDACGKYDLDSTIVTVEFNTGPVVEAPDTFEGFACEIAEICFPVGITDAEDNITDISVMPFGSYDSQSGNVCFTPDTYGTYQIIIIATDACGLVAADTTEVTATMNRPPVITAADSSIFSCERMTICVPITADDPDNNLDYIYAEGAGYYGGFACFSTSVSETRRIIITAVDSCGAVDVDTITVDVTINTAPLVVSGPDTSVFQCDFDEICIDVDVSDIDENINSIETNLGTYSAELGTVCFVPTEAGTYEIITTAFDDCGTAGADTTYVTVETIAPANIDCPMGPVSLYLCGPETVCHEIGITPDGADVNVSYGTYENGSLCFYADTAGTYVIEIDANTACGSDQCTVVFEIELGEIAQVECIGDTSIFLCNPNNICLPVSVTPEYAQVSVAPIGDFADGEVCFYADTAGLYQIEVIAATDCGADTCVMNVAVDFNAAPVVDAGSDTTYFQCDFVEICRTISVIDPDNAIDSVVVSPFGSYSAINNTVCFTPTDTGMYCITVTAYDECGATDSDEFCVTVTTGPVADIDCPTEPFYERLCDPDYICVPLAITPATAEVTVSNGTYEEGTLCIYADTAGTYNVTVTASEICGSETCVVPIVVEFDEYVTIGCPTLPVSVSLCTPDTVGILVPITPTSASITIQPAGIYDWSDKMIKFFADTSGHYEVTIIAGSPCSVDTCMVEADVSIYQVPEIACPGDFDTLVCLNDISEICFPVEVIGAEVEVTVSPEGIYSGGMVCIPITAAGSHVTTIIASSQCGADTCIMDINVIADEAPVLTVPGDLIVPWCDDEAEPLCIDGIFAVDNEGGPLTITQTCGMGEFTAVRDDSGAVCFMPPNIDSTYEFCFEVTDGCSIDSQSFLVTLYPSPACSVCVDVAIETDSCYVVGVTVPVRVMVETNDQVGGFDLLIGYDVSVMSFNYASQGEDIDGWEYFTYRLIDNENCGTSCPSGLIRLVGLADENNGAAHPPEEQLMPSGVLARMGMRIANNQNLGGMHLPISFHWIDCGDNTFANPAGDQLYMDARVYNSSDELIWDEFAEDLYPEESRPDGLGAVDSCLLGDKITPSRCVYFHNGGICVKHPDSIDARGDINLNGVAYEIADAVVFTNYFIYGLSAFTVNPDGQIAASDVNADGFTLTVADLVYLIRVIVGDADAIPKVSPNLLDVDLTLNEHGDAVSISADTDCPIGAALLIFEYDGVMPQAPMLSEYADDMELAYRISDNEIRVLIYSFEKNRAIDVGEGELLSIGYTGTGSITLVESSLASYSGQVINTEKFENLLPESFALGQNYPNPFNPATSIELSIPVACRWEMNIYNINGQCVRCFGGNAQPGIVTVNWDGRTDNGEPVASGIYFYKVQAGEFTAKKKMTLLK